MDNKSSLNLGNNALVIHNEDEPLTLFHQEEVLIIGEYLNIEGNEDDELNFEIEFDYPFKPSKIIINFEGDAVLKISEVETEEIIFFENIKEKRVINYEKNDDIKGIKIELLTNEKPFHLYSIEVFKKIISILDKEVIDKKVEEKLIDNTEEKILIKDSIDMKNNKILNCGIPDSDNDAITKDYLKEFSTNIMYLIPETFFDLITYIGFNQKNDRGMRLVKKKEETNIRKKIMFRWNDVNFKKSINISFFILFGDSSIPGTIGDGFSFNINDFIIDFNYFLRIIRFGSKSKPIRKAININTPYSINLNIGLEKVWITIIDADKDEIFDSYEFDIPFSERLKYLEIFFASGDSVSDIFMKGLSIRRNYGNGYLYNSLDLLNL